MIDRAVIANPETHYGNGKSATRLFFLQRLTGALNIAFTIFFAWFVVRLAGAERAEMLEVVRNPGIAVILALLIVNVCVHMRIGMMEVIEDYVGGPAHRLAMRANTLFCVAIAVLTIAAIAKIVFWG